MSSVDTKKDRDQSTVLGCEEYGTCIRKVISCVRVLCFNTSKTWELILRLPSARGKVDRSVELVTHQNWNGDTS